MTEYPRVGNPAAKVMLFTRSPIVRGRLSRLTFAHSLSIQIFIPAATSNVKHKKFVIFSVSLAVLFFIGGLLSQSVFLKAILAKYKSTDHFVVLGDDQRIRYEKSAEANAIALKPLLHGSQTQVESILHARFKKTIEVYVCSSQTIFNEYVFLSKNVKGAVYWGKLFLSPGAFSQDESRLAELTTHELTHYLFHTHLGEKAHLKNIPLWFREGIAVFVANGGADYIRGGKLLDLISSEEKQAFLSGETDFWFASRNPLDAVSKTGTANWLLYRVGALFVHFLRDAHPRKFDEMIQFVLAGMEFEAALKVTYGKTTEALLREFAQYLTTANA